MCVIILFKRKRVPMESELKENELFCVFFPTSIVTESQMRVRGQFSVHLCTVLIFFSRTYNCEKLRVWESHRAQTLE